MVDKPGRRRKAPTNWLKVAAIVVGVIVVGAAGWLVYVDYSASTAPVYAVIETRASGMIYLELYPQCAPKTVANFVTLADSGFYDNLVWHRIDPGFVIQTGDPNTRNGVNSTRSTWGMGGSNNTVPLEVTACSWIGNYAGYVAMAREGNDTSGLDTGTSQFYINLVNNTSLDHYYTVFGKVISGMGNVCDIANLPIYNSTAIYDSGSYLYDQPKNATAAMIDSITIIKASALPATQPIVPCNS